MNDDTYTPCTKCGRPMAYCKGKCGCKRCGCDCKEYGPAVCGAIRPRQPECPYTAVIPSLTVDHVDSLRDLCDTFAHVSDINTTFYIDDKHRTIITWAGPVEYDNYDLATNALGLRSQFLIDFANSRGAYYNKTGDYQVFNFGENCCGDAPVRLRVEWAGDYYPEGWVDIDEENGVETKVGNGHANIIRFQIPNNRVSFEDESTEEILSVPEVYELLESGKRVILDHVPLGAEYPYASSDDTIFAFSYTDNIELSSYVYDESQETTLVSYTGGAFAPCVNAGINTYLGVQITKEPSTQTYSFFVQGRGHFHADSL